jgi:hypothetical protein
MAVTSIPGILKKLSLHGPAGKMPAEGDLIKLTGGTTWSV